MVKDYSCFREDIEIDLMALGVDKKVIYCENADEVEYDRNAFVPATSGASKLVIPYYNVVCKFPVTVHRQRFEADSGEILEDTWETENFCAIEEYNYEQAVKANVEKAFARCEFYGEIKGIPTYIMERAEPFSSRSGNEKIDVTTVEAWRNDDLDSTWNLDIWNAFVEYYGLNFCLRLSEFIKEQDINDIRDANCGIIDGRPVLIDYSGYWEG